MKPDAYSGLTGSGAGYAVACPAREAFPKCRTTSEYAERGNIIHAYCRVIGLYPEKRAEALLTISDDDIRATCEGINLDAALEGLTVRGYEVAFALDVKKYSCRLIGHNIDRKYNDYLVAHNMEPLGPWEIPFTVDVLADWNGVPVELDYKTGQHIGDPAEHWQRKISAAGVMFYSETTSAISRVAYIHDDGSVTPDGAPFEYIDAVDTCDELARGIEAVWKARAMLALGEHLTVYPDREAQCKYCDCFNICPYWTNLVKGASGRLAEIKNGPDLSELSPEARGQIFDYVKDVLKVAGELEDRLREHVLREALPVDDKTEFRAETRTGRKYFDAAAARGLIVTLLGRLGIVEGDIQTTLESLNKKGKDYPEVRKRKRELPVVKKAS